jgi:hypothetical protein
MHYYVWDILAVEGLGHLDVVVPLDLWLGVDRQVVRGGRSWAASSGANISASRHWVVPSSAYPAFSPHQTSARRWASLRSTKHSPGKNEART